MKEKKYITPDMEITEFEVEDVIEVSLPNNNPEQDELPYGG